MEIPDSPSPRRGSGLREHRTGGSPVRSPPGYAPPAPFGAGFIGVERSAPITAHDGFELSDSLGSRLPATGYPPRRATAHRDRRGIFVDWPWPVSIICNLRSQRLMQSPRCPPGHGPFQARPGGDGEGVFFNRTVITGKELRSGSVLPAS